MTFSEKLKQYAKPDDLFPELTSAEKKFNYIIADVAVKIRNKRKELNLTQREFADFIGVSQGMVSKWESAEYNFTLESIVNLFDKLGIPFDLKEKSPKLNIACFKRYKDNWNMNISLKDKVRADIKELEESA